MGLWDDVRHMLTTGRSPAEDRAACELAEQWALWFLAKYPGLGDEEIAQLMRDELVNRRIATPANWAWATAEVVGRLRRTIVRDLVGR